MLRTAPLRRAALGLALMATCLPLVGCGGGGSSGSDRAQEAPPLADGPVAGAYQLALLTARREQLLDLEAAWGPVSFDDAFAQATASTQGNENGRLDLDPEASLLNVTPDMASPNYRLHDARFGPDLGLHLARSEDASVMAVMPLVQDSAPGFGVLVQRSHGMTRDDVLGTYHLFGHEVQARLGAVYRGSVLINPEESKAILFKRTPEGRAQEQRRFDHSIESDGMSAPGRELQGGFRPQGDFAAYVGSGSDADGALKRLSQMFLVRVSRDLTRADLSGTYEMHRMNLMTPVPSAVQGTVRFSGTGLASLAVRTENLGGFIQGGGDPRLGGYVVGDDGSVTLQIGAFDHFDGAATPDGNLVVLSSQNTDEAPQTLILLIRTSRDT